MPEVHGTVLLVDDDDEWMEAISDFLLEEGYAVVGAPNGLAALETLSRMQPFAVVTDIRMPFMDGRQLLVEVHAHDARVPVIVVTAEQVQDQDASLEGAFRVIRKPVPLEEFLSALEAARAHRAAHLPLQKLWRTARVAAPARDRDVVRSRWRSLRTLGFSIWSSTSPMHVVMLTVALASSFALFKQWRGKLS
jgi:DNA-binding NtrC family response regulator